ncbi:hypothetical protein OG785_04730 [Streptomyces sp. NBC_00006]|uniref:hypothetical protein n=1 Tax=unclassified Streptomyces TaxID=2593676 RepID=UPI00225A6CDC|nr:MULTISPECIES: hypothetical protein [unclassified Streptomyces]MCX4834220.1 hypothetical protein [Streptomyces sp. NBC_01016]MCX5529864.1 hypothetical protein [Streptomyces sp. NBC_00006]
MQMHTIPATARRWGHWIKEKNKKGGDAGMTTEAVIVIALMAILAMTVVGIIAAKVTAKANGIDLG